MILSLIAHRYVVPDPYAIIFFLLKSYDSFVWISVCSSHKAYGFRRLEIKHMSRKDFFHDVVVFLVMELNDTQLVAHI